LLQVEQRLALRMLFSGVCFVARIPLVLAAQQQQQQERQNPQNLSALLAFDRSRKWV
jgi:hypothetical protein